MIETVKKVARKKDEHINELKTNVNILKEDQKKEKSSLNVEIVRKEEKIKNLEARMRVKQDDFSIIDGIGKKVSSILRLANIDTFSKLASTDLLTLKNIIEDSDPRMLRLTDPTVWIEQARLAADDDWLALSALKLKIKEDKNK